LKNKYLSWLKNLQGKDISIKADIKVNIRQVYFGSSLSGHIDNQLGIIETIQCIYFNRLKMEKCNKTFLPAIRFSKQEDEIIRSILTPK
jgi:transketolase N-terminal domain/subunit